MVWEWAGWAQTGAGGEVVGGIDVDVVGANMDRVGVTAWVQTWALWAPNIVT